jgi:hypothetical protein
VDEYSAIRRINMDEKEQLKLLLKKYLTIETTRESEWGDTYIYTKVRFDGELICEDYIRITEGK